MRNSKLIAWVFAALICAAGAEAADELPLRGETSTGGQGVNAFQANWPPKIAAAEVKVPVKAPVREYLEWRNRSADSPWKRENFARVTPYLGLNGPKLGFDWLDDLADSLTEGGADRLDSVFSLGPNP